MLLKVVEFVLVLLRFLKGKALCGIGHKGLVMPYNFLAATAQDAHYLLYAGIVLIL